MKQVKIMMDNGRVYEYVYLKSLDNFFNYNLIAMHLRMKSIISIEYALKHNSRFPHIEFL